MAERVERVERGEEAEEREWYVRLENMYLNDSYVGYKRIITIGSRCSSLVEAILLYYGLPSRLQAHIRIWSSPFQMQRLDRLEVIPEGEMFLSVEIR